MSGTACTELCGFCGRCSSYWEAPESDWFTRRCGQCGEEFESPVSLQERLYVLCDGCLTTKAEREQRRVS